MSLRQMIGSWPEGGTNTRGWQYPARTDAEIQALGPARSVVQCAYDVGLLPENRYNQLLGGIFETEHSANLQTIDFSQFVSPSDPLITSREHMSRVPEGAFLAFIRVDEPAQDQHTGRRHLLHPLLSMGSGLAAGMPEPRIAGLSGQGTWGVYPVDDRLNWVPVSSRRRYDAINTGPIGVDTTDFIRLRYRPSGEIPTGALAARWGHPNRSEELLQRIVYGASLQGWMGVEASHNGEYQRPTFTFRVDRATFREFFNSPNELRGHYYLDAGRGDAYTRRTMREISAYIDWAQVPMYAKTAQHGWAQQPHHEPPDRRALLEAAFAQGKIWFAEQADTDKEGLPLWRSDPWNNIAEQIYPPNRRWTDANRRRNLDRLLAENGLDNQANLTAEQLAIRAQLTAKFVGVTPIFSSEAASLGTCYFDWVSPDPFYRNLDVKGAWVPVDTKKQKKAFVPKHKVGRGSQVKWFGFT